MKVNYLPFHATDILLICIFDWKTSFSKIPWKYYFHSSHQDTIWNVMKLKRKVRSFDLRACLQRNLSKLVERIQRHCQGLVLENVKIWLASNDRSYFERELFVKVNHPAWSIHETDSDYKPERQPITPIRLSERKMWKLGQKHFPKISID